jgi:hypothetical protein
MLGGKEDNTAAPTPTCNRSRRVFMGSVLLQKVIADGTSAADGLRPLGSLTDENTKIHRSIDFSRGENCVELPKVPGNDETVGSLKAAKALGCRAASWALPTGYE